jgi:hypothetical protein
MKSKKVWLTAYLVIIGVTACSADPLTSLNTAQPLLETVPVIEDPIEDLIPCEEEFLLYRYKSYYLFAPSEEPGWNQLTHLVYGFNILIPADAAVELSINAIEVYWDEMRLAMAFRFSDETVNTQRTGVGAGRLVKGDSILFLNEPLLRGKLIYENALIEILYNSGAEFSRGDLVFNCGLDPTVDYYHRESGFLGIPVEIQQQADQIMESVSLVSDSE